MGQGRGSRPRSLSKHVPQASSHFSQQTLRPRREKMGSFLPWALGKEPEGVLKEGKASL